MRSLVDPRLGASLVGAGIGAGHYPNRVTIERAASTRNSVGELTGTPAAVTGLVDIPARVERDRGQAATDETRLPDRTGIIDRYAIALAGYYPTIRLSDEPVDELGRRFELTTIDHDAAHTFTFLRGEVVA